MVFTLGVETYAVPIALVGEILALPAITRVPRAEPWLLGVFNLRGDILSVVDVRGMLGCSAVPQGTNTRLLVVQTSIYRVAVLVDSVLEVVSIPPEDLVAADGRGRGSSRYVNHVAFRQGRLISILDLEALLTADSMRVYH